MCKGSVRDAGRCSNMAIVDSERHRGLGQPPGVDGRALASESHRPGATQPETWATSFNLSGPQLPPVEGHACLLCHFSRVQLLETPWTVARQAPLSMGFSWQEYWSGLPGPPPGDLSDPGSKPMSLLYPELQAILYCWTIGEALRGTWWRLNRVMYETVDLPAALPH